METVLHSGVMDSRVFMDGKRPTPIVRDAHALLLRGIDALERSHVDEAVGLLRQSVQLDANSFYGNLALGIALDLAKTVEEKKTARDLLTSEERRDPRRAWRPDFGRLLGRPGRKP